MRYTINYSLYLVTDRSMTRGRRLDEIVVESIEGGVTMVQLREKTLDTKDFMEQAAALKAAASRCSVPLIINDRLDIALACSAAGVHLGQSDMRCAQARGIAGRSMIIGVSVSTVEEALRAQADGADYLAVSPVFDTPTKTDTPPATGIEGLREIRNAVQLPVVAIGGITTANAAEVMSSGVDGIAVVSAIMASPDPRAAARTLRAAMRSEKTGPPFRSRNR